MLNFGCRVDGFSRAAFRVGVWCMVHSGFAFAITAATLSQF